MRPIVAGVNGTASARHAVRWAAAEASRRHRGLRLVHVCRLDLPRSTRHAGATAYHEERLRQGRDWLSAAAAIAREQDPGLDVDTDLRDGSPVSVLLAESADAELLVLGRVGVGRIRALVDGPVPLSLAARAHCPVVVMRAMPPDAALPSDGPVVVGVANTASDDRVLEFAFDAAAARRTGLVAVHSWLGTDTTRDWVVSPWLIDWTAVQQDERRMFAERMTGWCDKYPDVAVRRMVVRGDPATVLPHAARGAQLLVVGSRGRGDVAATVLGSVSRSVLSDAPCPVAVVRDTGENHSPRREES